MHAAVVTRDRTGARRPSVERLADPPAPTGTQVLVQVSGSSVNGTDLALVRGSIPTLPGRPRLLGFDVSGEVVGCGERVTSVGVGDQVVALIGHRGGGQADQVLVSQSAVAIAPATVPLEHAAGLPLAGLTALQALHRSAGLSGRRRPRVLVLGAAGGIGSFAVQIARQAGATVVASARGDRGAYLREHGAHDVIDATDDPVAAGRWDVIIDTPAVLPLRAAAPHLADGGVLVSTRPLSLDVVRGVLAPPRGRPGPRMRAVATRASGLDLARLVRAVDRGELRIPLDAIFPLERVADAHDHVRSGRVRGKVVVSVP